MTSLEISQLKSEYERIRAKGLNINMARGKPEPRQIALSNGLLHCLNEDDCFTEDGTDVRNYLGIDGIPEIKRLFAEILNVPAEAVIAGGNSSLNMMFDCIVTFLLAGLWKKGDKFICPSPGYDRHFAISDYLGFELLPVPMTADGPDIEAVERLALQSDVAGMWNVPVFSNPQGYVYSREIIKRLTEMPAAHPHFRIIWDNAYAVHHFRGAFREFKVELNDRSILFTSFSKISFAGAAVSAMAASENNRKLLLKRTGVQTVGPDKINQLRHVRYFKNLSNILSHMEKHAAIMRPKFDMISNIFSAQLSEVPDTEWVNPDGGYFVNLCVPRGCAKETETLCKNAGLTITEAGAAFPYKRDPDDRNLRIAPSYLSLKELEAALEILCVSVKLAATAHVGVHG